MLVKMINVVEMWWDLELEKMMSNIKCSLHEQWLGAAVCRQRAGTNICQMVYQNIDFRISACSVVQLEGTQTGQCANCALACCSLLQSQLLLQTKSKQRLAALCLSPSVWKKYFCSSLIRRYLIVFNRPNNLFSSWQTLNQTEIQLR